MELGNLIKVTYGANVILGAYNSSNANGDSTEMLDDKSVAIIRYLLEGKVSENSQNESYGNEAISMTQGFADTASTIKDKFARMKELAEQAASGEYSDVEVEAMQTELEQLVEEINDLVTNTAQNDNKLFSGEGTTISISIGNNSTIDIAAMDLSINGEGLDLTTDPEAALAAIQSKVSQSEYYSEYLGDQLGHLEKLVHLIEFEKYNDMGVEVQEFDMELAMELAKEVASSAAAMTLQEMLALYNGRENVGPYVGPYRALQLLKDEIEQAQQKSLTDISQEW